MFDPASKMTTEEINKLPLKKFRGPVHLIRDSSSLAEICQKLSREPVLGFDTETRPAFQKGQSFPPSLLQLATDQEVWIFQLLELSFPNPVSDLLTSSKCLKVGIGLNEDKRALSALIHSECMGFVDIGTMVKKMGYTQTGLRPLAAKILGFRISKNQKCSNWARKELNQAQIQYAATDAWISFLLYQALQPSSLRELKNENRKQSMGTRGS